MNLCRHLCQLVMKMLAVGTLAVIFCCGVGSVARAQTSADDEIFEFKENYVPIEYPAEPDYSFYIDVGVLALMMVGAVMLMSWRPLRPYRRLVLWFPALSLLYFGIFRGGCICPVGAVANVSLALIDPELIGWATIAIFLLPLFFALIMGRVFCSAGCPLGAVQDLLYNRKKYWRLPRWLLRVGVLSTALILLATIWFAIKGPRFFICEIDPYRSLFHFGYVWIRRGLALFNGASYEHLFLRAGSLAMWLYLAVMLLLGSRIPRVFCRFICPYGFLLGLISAVSFRPRKIDSEGCLYCSKCEKVCPVQAITIDRKNGRAEVSAFSCVQCDRCSDACSSGMV